MPKLKLSLKPLRPSRWEKHEPTGAEFDIAALTGEMDDELSRKNSDIYGNVQPLAFAYDAAPVIIKGWRGVGDDGSEVPVNEQTLKAFVASHGLTVMPWIIRRARSLDHYREQEIEAAKNG